MNQRSKITANQTFSYKTKLFASNKINKNNEKMADKKLSLEYCDLQNIYYISNG